MVMLDDLPVDELGLYQQVALMRLQLKFTGVTHGMLADAGTEIGRLLAEAADDTGMVSMLRLHGLLKRVTPVWNGMFERWVKVFESARREGAAIPFGVMARQHQVLVGGGMQEAAPVKVGVTGVPFFDEQLKDVLEAARNRVYSDGFTLSERLWRLNGDSLDGIKRVLYEGVANGESAWKVAKKLEQYLGAGSECPRWTSTRLRLTKKEIAAGDQRGLKAGDECASQGVAYNALRLARNEIQIAHHTATAAMFDRLPWIEKQRIFLSAAHPVADMCDDVVSGGENGEGVYPKGTIVLPLHVQCLCGQEGVLPPRDEFVGRLRGWIRGEDWPAMDSYAGWIGGSNRAGIGEALSPGAIGVLGEAMLRWLGGENGMDKGLGIGG